ncbi:MAG: nucleotidyl transferase AbiEii/AbiGii toxin family protein [Eubacterium sp.]
MAVKDMGASVLSRLKKQAKQTKMNYQTCLQLFVQEEFLRRLEVSGYVNNFVLKGGMFLYTISKYEGRPTMDIDFMLKRISNDIEELKEIVAKICEADTHNDYIEMKVTGAKNITPEKKYPGVSINMMAYIKNVRIPFSVDIGVDDVIIPGMVMRTVPTRLDGFKEPCVYTYSLESAMAEKFEAILKRMTATSRMKDFYDLFYWSQMFDFDGRVLLEAIFETLQHRGTPYEINSLKQIRAFDQNKFLCKLWNNYNPGPMIEKPDFSTVLIQIEKFIGPVYDAMLRENEFLKKWYSKKSMWQ